MVTLIVTEEIISRPAELVAPKPVVVLIAAEADLKVKLSHRAVVLKPLPLLAGTDHPRVEGFLDYSPTDTWECESSHQSEKNAIRKTKSTLQV